MNKRTATGLPLLAVTLILWLTPAARAATDDESAVVDFRQMSLLSARRAADAAVAACREQGFQVAVAVVDRAGQLQAFLRDRFAGPHTIRVAQDKAWTSASFRISTADLARATGPESTEHGIRAVARVMVNGGGLPIAAAGSHVGAIGVSGAPSGAADESSPRPASTQSVTISISESAGAGRSRRQRAHRGAALASVVCVVAWLPAGATAAGETGSNSAITQSRTAGSTRPTAPEHLARGEQLFLPCRSCHAVGGTASDARPADPGLDAPSGAARSRRAANSPAIGVAGTPPPAAPPAGRQTRTGPPLQGLPGRRIASADFAYSRALTELGDKGMRWDARTLSAFLQDPQGFAPGMAMILPGIVDPADREALIDYLFATLTSAEAASQMRDDPPLPPALAALAGDPAYGEYLASECLTCHQVDGSDAGIPPITGWNEARFKRVLHAYRVRARQNPVMQTIAGALGDPEIAALAAWFATNSR